MIRRIPVTFSSLKAKVGYNVSANSRVCYVRNYSNQEGLIPSVVLEELRKDTSNENCSDLYQEQKILILDPSKTIDKNYSRIVKMHSDSEFEKNLRREPIIVGLEKEGSDIRRSNRDTISETIDSFMPSSEKISRSKFDYLNHSLSRSFSRKQLIAYIKEKHQGKPRGISKYNKDQLASFILNQIWEVRVTNNITIEEFLATNKVKLSEAEIFLLSMKFATMSSQMSRIGVSFTLDKVNNFAELKGTESKTTNAEIILNKILGQISKEKIDLRKYKELFEKRFGKLSLAELQKYTGVFFKNIKDDCYELIAFNKRELHRCRRLLLWIMDHKSHSKESFCIPQNLDDFEILPFKDDESLAWNLRDKSYFYIQGRNVIKPNDMLLYDLDRFSDQNLKMLFSRDAHSGFNESSIVDDDIGKETWSLLKEIGIIDSKIDTDLSKNNEKRSDDAFELKGLTLEDQENIYRNLTDFSYRAKLKGVDDANLNSPLFTVSLGKILLSGNTKGDSNKEFFSAFAKEEGGIREYSFNSTIPLISDKMFQLPRINEESTLYNNYKNLTDGPYKSVIQIMLEPSPFIENSSCESDIDESTKYPPVQLTIELNESLKPDLETLSLVTVEGENNYYVALPDMKADLKICCQLSGNILEGPNDTSFAEHETGQEFKEKELSDILRSTISKYQRFDSQPGLKDFLVKSSIILNGKGKSHIESTVDLIINQKTIKYYYVSMFLKRQLDVHFESTKGTRLVQYSLSEGGSLGGRTTEVDFIGDDATEKDKFNDLIYDSIKLISEL